MNPDTQTTIVQLPLSTPTSPSAIALVCVTSCIKVYKQKINYIIPQYESSIKSQNILLYKNRVS